MLGEAVSKAEGEDSQLLSWRLTEEAGSDKEEQSGVELGIIE